MQRVIIPEILLPHEKIKKCRKLFRLTQDEVIELMNEYLVDIGEPTKERSYISRIENGVKVKITPEIADCFVFVFEKVRIDNELDISPINKEYILEGIGSQANKIAENLLNELTNKLVHKKELLYKEFLEIKDEIEKFILEYEEYLDPILLCEVYNIIIEITYKASLYEQSYFYLNLAHDLSISLYKNKKRERVLNRNNVETELLRAADFIFIFNYKKMRVLYMFSDYDEMYRVGMQGVKFYEIENLEETQSIHELYANLILAAKMKGDHDKCLKLSEKALSFNINYDIKGFIKLINANIYADIKREYIKAESTYLEAIKDFKALNDYKNIALAYRDLADLKLDTEDYDGFYYYKEEADSIEFEYDHIYIAKNSKMNLDVQLKIGDLDTVESEYRKALNNSIEESTAYIGIKIIEDITTYYIQKRAAGHIIRFFEFLKVTIETKKTCLKLHDSIVKACIKCAAKFPDVKNINLITSEILNMIGE